MKKIISVILLISIFFVSLFQPVKPAHAEEGGFWDFVWDMAVDMAIDYAIDHADEIVDAVIDAFSDSPSDSNINSQTTSSGNSQKTSSQDPYTQAENYLNKKQYLQALEIFRNLANQGHAPAQDKLGWMYQNGWGVKQDYSQAMTWYRKAAEQNNKFAQASIGLLYYKGWGVTQDYDEALKWYKKAAAQDYKIAQKRCDMIERLKIEKPFIKNLESNNSLPYPAVIFDDNVYIRNTPNVNVKASKKLNSGHPVSIYKTSDSDNEFWYYVKTASGTEGWALASYVVAIDKSNLSRTDNEKSNRHYSLPSQGRVVDITSGDQLNVRNLPSLTGSKVLDKIKNGSDVTASEIFSESKRDWYRITTENGNKGWVNGKYLSLYNNVDH